MRRYNLSTQSRLLKTRVPCVVWDFLIGTEVKKMYNPVLQEKKQLSTREISINFDHFSRKKYISVKEREYTG